MANEGSTKPTYSELEAQLAEAEEIIESERCQFRKMYDVDVSASKVIEDLGKAYDELARVRGLLQRITEIVTEDDVCRVCHNRTLPHMGDKELPHRADCKFKLALSGAESADIGKIDAADKSGVEMGKVNRVEESDAVCPGCHTRACNGECMRPMRFKGDTR